MTRATRRRWTLGTVLAWVLALGSACSTATPVSTSLIGSAGSMYRPVVTAGDTVQVGYFLDIRGTVTPYRLGVGDVLKIHVADYPDLSRDEIVVLPDGRISLNLIGSVAAAGKTVDDVAAEIAARYRDRQIRRPEVVVSVTRGQERVRQLLRSVGGEQGVSRLDLKIHDQPVLELPFIPPIAVGRPLADIRRDIKEAYEREFGPELQVTVNVTSRLAPTLHVMGEVKKPGSVEAYPGLSLLGAVAAAGGFEDSAERGEVLVLRFKPDGSYDHWAFDLTEKGFTDARASEFGLQHADIVYVSKSTVAKVNQFVELYIRNNMPFSIGFGGLIPLGAP